MFKGLNKKFLQGSFLGILFLISQSANAYWVEEQLQGNYLDFNAMKPQTIDIGGACNARQIQFTIFNNRAQVDLVIAVYEDREGRYAGSDRVPLRSDIIYKPGKTTEWTAMVNQAGKCIRSLKVYGSTLEPRARGRAYITFNVRRWFKETGHWKKDLIAYLNLGFEKGQKHIVHVPGGCNAKQVYFRNRMNNSYILSMEAIVENRNGRPASRVLVPLTPDNRYMPGEESGWVHLVKNQGRCIRSLVIKGHTPLPPVRRNPRRGVRPKPPQAFLEIHVKRWIH